MEVVRKLEKQVSEFIDSQEEELILEPEESMIIFAFSEEYEKLACEVAKKGIAGVIANSFSKNEVYLGEALDSKKGKHFLDLYKELPDDSPIFMSSGRMGSVKFNEGEILNKIFVDLKKIDISKYGSYRVLLRK